MTAAVLLLGVKALFFYADNGYRDASAGGPIACEPGAACVYQRYLLVEDGARVAGLEAAGVTDRGLVQRPSTGRSSSRSRA